MAVAVCLMSFPLRASGRRPPELRFELDPSTVTAGRTLVVRFHSPARIMNPRMTLNDRSAEFYSVSTGSWRAFWGISCQESPGVKNARFEVLWNKRVIVSTISFTVEAGTFPVSHIPLTKSQNNLFTSGQLTDDNEILAAAYKKAPIPRKMWSGYFVWPTTGVVSSVFGARRSYGRRPPGSGHSGMDIANVEGTLITAPARGRVVLSRRLDSFGNAVVLEHGQGVFTYYLHMVKPLAKEGDFLEVGSPIGLMGKEGIATGPHLHWSMVVSGERVDPREWTERLFD